MRITLAQIDIRWADKEANLAAVEQILLPLAGETDLVVLPEMFTTGFCTDNLELAETMDGETVSRLKAWAQSYGFAVAGSFIAREDDKFFNRAFFALPDGTIRTADKRHLFSYGGEDKLFTSGDSRLVVNYMGINIFLLVCYDIRFPVWSRNRNNEYDLLLYTASFPHARMDAWDALLRARAIENQAYVCGVNRVGNDGNAVSYSGHSVLLDFKGRELRSFPEFESAIATVEISKSELDHFRQRFAFWQDADDFRLIT